MIYTVTFSPAIDYVVDLNKLEIGEINRTVREFAYPGGKGINVSLVLANLGKPSVATGFLGGFTGDYIKSELARRNVASGFIEVDGVTRINVKIRAGKETAINGQGPQITAEDIEQLIRQLERLGKEDLLVISGTVPSSLPADIYERILERIKDAGVTLIVDATKDILLNTLKYHPLLVKPNKEELEEMFEVKITNDDELILTAKRLLALGAENVIVSLGGDGALLVGRNVETSLREAPQGKVVNTVGAGDSLVAGFIDAYVDTHDVSAAFRRGIATGSASAFSETLATKEEVEAVLKQMD
ncbi:MAG: 1-phosphofructokinase [Clostridia bacterium]|nr:1-phosphofructokinase [Clostridia bacterium]